MSSRVRKIILVDGKTSGVTSSNLICHLDPRGGAAITGENGVGKTTSLQIIPLFFGCLPSNIVKQGNTVQPMLQFVLPNTTSAIAFEYQRGNDQDDVRMVVIRRHLQTNTPEYRLFRCGFREELFIRQEAGGLRLLDDVESVRAASQIGVVVEGRKLSGSEYRAVILRVRSQTKDADALNRISSAYSFARRSLAHMDRLVSAIVKERIDFRDFTEVAESMVQEALGGSGGEGAGKVALKNMHVQVDRWLVNREACEKAEKLKPRIEKLLADVESSGAHRSKLRAMRADVHTMRRIVGAILDRNRASLSENSVARDAALEKEISSRQSYKEVRESVSKHLGFVKDKVEDDKRRINGFEADEVSLWAERLHEIPSINERIHGLQAQIDLTLSESENLEREFAEAISGRSIVIAQRLEKLESSKSAAYEKSNSDKSTLYAKDQENQNKLNVRHIETRSVVDAVHDELIKEAADFKARTLAPQPSAELKARLQEAEDRLDVIKPQAVAARTAFANCERRLNAMRIESHQVNSDLVSARHKESIARTKLDDAKRAQKPKPGSVLATLRESNDSGWRSDIARVISPDLLDSTEMKLTPVILSNDAQDVQSSTVFGWHVDVTAIPTPSWADADRLNQEIAEHAGFLQACETELSRLKSLATANDKAFKSTEVELKTIEYEFTVTQQNHASQEQIVKDQKRAIAQQLLKAVEEAQRLYAGITLQISAKKRERSDLDGVLQQSLLALKHQKEAGEAAISDQLRDALNAIDNQKSNEIAAESSFKVSMKLDLDRRLKEKGVDADRLNQLQTEKKQAETQRNEREDNRSKVAVWQDWTLKGGMQSYNEKCDEKLALEGRFVIARDTADRHEKDMTTSRAEHTSRQSKLIEKIGIEENDLQKLELLDGRLTPFEPEKTSVANEDTLVSVLEGRVSAALRIYEQQERKVLDDARGLEHQMTATDDEVSQLVSGYLKQNCSAEPSSPCERAQHLSHVYGKIPEQIVAQINRELVGILETFDTVRQQVRRYEKGVREFNTKLQQGIQKVVSGFARLQDFEVNVVTTFEEIGFLKKLDALSDLIGEYRSMNHYGTNRTVPSKATAEQLQSISGALGKDSFEVSLGKYMTLSGRANDAGIIKTFTNEEGLKNISSTGITALAMVTLLAGMLNVVRGADEIYIPWSSDEIGRFDAGNFRQLIGMLKDNRIDVITASPDLSASAYDFFDQRYLFKAGADWMIYEGDNAQLEDINLSLKPHDHRAPVIDNYPPPAPDPSPVTQPEPAPGSDTDATGERA